LVWFWVWKISPKNPKFFNFFVRVKKYPDQRRAGLLFTAGQKNAQVGLGQGSSQQAIPKSSFGSDQDLSM